MSLAAALLVAPATARANGAFPDSFAVFAPPERPGYVLLATNFGLIVSLDDGATWSYLCEQAIAPNAFNYQLGPAPDHLLLAASFEGLAVSRDDGCTWTTTAPGLEGLEVTDAFPDPTDPAHVLAIGRARTATASFTLFRSRDGARSFTEEVLVAPAGVTLQSVELSRVDPRKLVVTAWAGFPPSPSIFTSTASGDRFREVDASPWLGAHLAAIAAIDPVLEDTLYLRVYSTSETGDSLALSEDLGLTSRRVLDLEGRMTSFARLAGGRLVVGSSIGPPMTSTDRGETFAAWSAAPSLRGLAERAGVLYAAADIVVDGMVVAVSRDDGTTFAPLLAIEDLDRIMDCPGRDLEALCRGPLEVVKAQLGPPPDAGARPDGGGGQPSTGGCSCSARVARSARGAGAPPGASGASVLLALALVLRCVGARLRRTGPAGSGPRVSSGPCPTAWRAARR